MEEEEKEPNIAKGLIIAIVLTIATVASGMYLKDHPEALTSVMENLKGIGQLFIF